MKRWSRKLHRWGAILIAVPTLLVIMTGLMLQLKKQVAWVQPPTQRGVGDELKIDWEQILNAAAANSQSGVKSWDDINRLDVRPSRGIIKVRCENGWELQLDAANGDLLSSAYRRSDLIESLHDGSFFSDTTKLYVFFANGLVLLGLWLTGIYLWYLPIQSRRNKRKRIAKKAISGLDGQVKQVDSNAE